MSSYTGKKILITAGPTRENLDPVRFLSNHSSGKMGFAIARAFLDAGAEVILVSGPVEIELTHPNLELVKIESALEMLDACSMYFDAVSICVFAAAVADYRPAIQERNKIKKEEEFLMLRLIKNPDIAQAFGKVKRKNQISIGFALETKDELMYARSKLLKKNLDLVILNTPNDPGAAFGFDTNKITIIDKNDQIRQYELKSKKEVARDILLAIEELLIAGSAIRD